MDYKEADIILLPAEYKEFNGIGDICKFDYGLAVAQREDIGYPPYDMYFVTDEKVEWLDYYYSPKMKIVDQKDSKTSKLPKWCKKVVASTNQELLIPIDKPFAKIPLDFIRDYILEEEKPVKVLLKYSVKHSHFVKTGQCAAGEVGGHNVWIQEPTLNGDFEVTILDTLNYRFTLNDMIRAGRYAYDYHATTSFPDKTFDENCKNNLLQWLSSQIQN